MGQAGIFGIFDRNDAIFTKNSHFVYTFEPQARRPGAIIHVERLSGFTMVVCVRSTTAISSNRKRGKEDGGKQLRLCTRGAMLS